MVESDEGSAEGPAPSTRADRVRGWITRTRLFLASYAPLLLIFSVQSWPRWGYSGAWAAAGTLAILDGWRLTRGASRRTAWPRRFENVRDHGQAVSGYLATYLLPLIAAPPFEIQAFLAYAIYFGVAWIVYVNSDLALINPTLYIFGWRVVEATYEEDRVLVVCREVPVEGADVRAVDFLKVYVVREGPD